MNEYKMRNSFVLLSHLVLEKRINVLRICEFNVSRYVTKLVINGRYELKT